MLLTDLHREAAYHAWPRIGCGGLDLGLKEQLARVAPTCKMFDRCQAHLLSDSILLEGPIAMPRGLRKGMKECPYGIVIRNSKGGIIGSLGIPRNSQKGFIGSLGIPRDSKKGILGSLGIPRNSQHGIVGLQ